MFDRIDSELEEVRQGIASLTTNFQLLEDSRLAEAASVAQAIQDVKDSINQNATSVAQAIQGVEYVLDQNATEDTNTREMISDQKMLLDQLTHIVTGHTEMLNQFAVLTASLTQNTNLLIEFGNRLYDLEVYTGKVVPPPPIVLPQGSLGIRFGYGPAEATVDEMMLEVQDDAALEPSVTLTQALDFWYRRYELPPNLVTEEDKERYRRQFSREFGYNAVRDRAGRAVSANTGIGQRLHQFWCDHFTAVPKAINQRGMIVAYKEMIRNNMAGKFTDLLQNAIIHPMMIIFLNQESSIGDGAPAATATTGLNENLGREILELHTIGVGGSYTQDDVRALANLLAGLRNTTNGIGVKYEPRWAAPTTQTILGVDYPENSIDEIKRALNDIAHHPETALHLANKLIVHFFDQPQPELAQAMADAYLANDTDLMPMYRLLVEHHIAKPIPLNKHRQPIDWMFSALKVMGLTAAEIKSLDYTHIERIFDCLTDSGQPWDTPGGPNGWPEESSAWMAPNQVVARASWAQTAPVAIFNAIQRPMPDYRDLLVNGTSASDNTLLWLPRAQSSEVGMMALLISPELLWR